MYKWYVYKCVYRDPISVCISYIVKKKKYAKNEI